MSANSLANEAAQRESRLDMERMIRADSLQRLSLVLIVVSIIPWGAFLDDTSQPWPLLVFISLTIGGMGIFVLRKRYPAIAQTLLLLVPIASLALALRFFANPAIPYYAVLIVIAGFALTPIHGLAAALLSTVVLVILRPAGALPIWAITLLWLAMAVVWIASQGLGTALEWAWSSQQQTAALMANLRSPKNMRYYVAGLTSGAIKG